MTVPIQESVAGRTPAHFAPVLSVQDLTTSFKIENGWKEVIRNISFDIAPGETVAIVGGSPAPANPSLRFPSCGFWRHGRAKWKGRSFLPEEISFRSRKRKCVRSAAMRSQ